MTPADPTPPVREPADRPLGAIYLAVVVVEIITLLGLWWFQTTFGRG